MNKQLLLLFCCIILCAAPCRSSAQKKTQTRIAAITENGSNVLFAVTSDKKFIFANNRYVLHIGDKVYTRYYQTYDNGQGKLSFIISRNEFNSLPDDTKVYLTYGSMETDEAELQLLSQRDFPSCWALGIFSKALLSK